MTTIKSRYNVTQQEAIELVATLLANNPSTKGLYYQLCHSITIWITSMDPLDKSYATDPISLALDSLQPLYNDLKDLVEPGDPTRYKILDEYNGHHLDTIKEVATSIETVIKATLLEPIQTEDGTYQLLSGAPKTPLQQDAIGLLSLLRVSNDLPLEVKGACYQLIHSIIWKIATMSKAELDILDDPKPNTLVLDTIGYIYDELLNSVDPEDPTQYSGEWDDFWAEYNGVHIDTITSAIPLIQSVIDTTFSLLTQISNPNN